MKKRVITGIFYVIIMLGLLAMKLFIPALNGLEYGALGVDLLFWAISVFGAYEFLRAVGTVSPVQRWTAITTCALIIPAFVLTKMITQALGRSGGEEALISLLAVASVGAIVVASLTVFDHEKSNLQSTAYAEMCILYCGALVSVGANINHLALNTKPAIIFLFFICPAVDSFAFFFGKLFGKLLPYKLAPKTSPNKTIIGSVGGILGGVFAAVLTWLMCEFVPVGNIGLEYDGALPDIVVLILFSIPTAIFAQLGDLFESAIKRSCGIKDMGNILPGHGGVLDRFDSTLFAGVGVVVCFMMIR